jgi:hypothetical protein
MARTSMDGALAAAGHCIACGRVAVRGHGVASAIVRCAHNCATTAGDQPRAALPAVSVGGRLLRAAAIQRVHGARRASQQCTGQRRGMDARRMLRGSPFNTACARHAARRGAAGPTTHPAALLSGAAPALCGRHQGGDAQAPLGSGSGASEAAQPPHDARGALPRVRAPGEPCVPGQAPASALTRPRAAAAPLLAALRGWQPRGARAHVAARRVAADQADAELLRALGQQPRRAVRGARACGTLAARARLRRSRAPRAQRVCRPRAGGVPRQQPADGGGGGAAVWPPPARSG